MVGIEAFLEQTDGTTLVCCPVTFMNDLLSLGDQHGCIRFIDPYGHTVFNMGQCLTLLVEWDNATGSDGAPELLWMTSVRDLIERCTIEPHLLVRFVGD